MRTGIVPTNENSYGIMIPNFKAKRNFKEGGKID